MKVKNLRASRISKLSKGRLKGVGFWESIILKITGWIDGRRNLPRECEGSWLSPHIDREVHSYDEFCSKVWGQLQIEAEDAYARLGVLTDSIDETRRRLEMARDELNTAVASEGSSNMGRKPGESKLTESQVAARRGKEKAQRLSGYRGRVSSLQTQLASDLDEFSLVRNKIIEDNNSTRLICARVRDHLYQRLAVYWNSALKRHPESSKMPAVPRIDVTPRSELVYLKPHEVLMQKVDMLTRAIDAEKEVK
jgi:hypothetical protein